MPAYRNLRDVDPPSIGAADANAVVRVNEGTG